MRHCRNAWALWRCVICVNQGVQPMALLSLMARLGSSDPVELRSDMAALIEGFDVNRFGATPTRFDVRDLFPLTARHLQSLTFADVADAVVDAGVPAALAEPFWATTRKNITTLGDLKAGGNCAVMGPSR